jgi:hypothetical protein
MAKVEHDTTPDMVAALAQDIKEQREFHDRRWAESADAQPGRADFIIRRANQLFDSNPDSVRRVMALIVEVDGFDEQAAFAIRMGEEMPEASAVYGHLGSLTIAEQQKTVSAETVYNPDPDTEAGLAAA